MRAVGPHLAQVAPLRPGISIGNMKSFVLKPVAQMMQSTSCSTPSDVTIPPSRSE